jgi:ribosomal protein L11 methylase PrmA
MQKPDVIHHPSSYRDPSGFIFEKDGILYRQINLSFKKDFDHFTSSGCYDELRKKGLLISHQVVQENITESKDHYLTIKPEKIAIVSYSYEWSFEMLKDAALLTLQLVKESLPFGIILKDATPYNIQWHNGKLIFIDTLSFGKYDSLQPWIAYRQFCECFLNPLLIMHYSGQSLHQLQLAFPEGIPVSITKSLLPWRSRLSFHTYLHVHLQDRVTKAAKNRAKHVTFSSGKLKNLIASLETLVRSLRLKDKKTAWSAYYSEASGRDDYLEQKKSIISRWLDGMQTIKKAADLGANEGEFSRILAKKGIETIAADFDPYCINRLYKNIKSNNLKNIQPFVVDLANPSPAIGVNNKERSSFIDRTRVDLVLALALLHHLVIGKNIPFFMTADILQQMTSILIIEFIPKNDEKVKVMLRHKTDSYAWYEENEFEEVFKMYFSITRKEMIVGSQRVLYLMKKHEG